MTGARRGKGGRPPLISRDDVVAAAIAIVAAEGLDALTMRGIGTRLGVAAMSLYRDALRAFAFGYRAMLLRHPNAVPLLAT